MLLRYVDRDGRIALRPTGVGSKVVRRLEGSSWLFGAFGVGWLSDIWSEAEEQAWLVLEY